MQNDAGTPPAQPPASPPKKTGDLVSLIAAADNGAFLQTNNDVLAHIVASMHTLAQGGGKPKAKINLSFSLQMIGDQLLIEADQKFTTPKPPRKATTMYASADGTLTPESRTQMNMFGEAAPPTPKPPLGVVR